MARAVRRPPRQAGAATTERVRSGVSRNLPSSSPPSSSPPSAPSTAPGPQSAQGEAPGVEPRPPGGQPAWLTRVSAWLAKDALTLSTLVVGLLYGVTRPAYASFYSSLGMTPEAIGLSQPLILFRAALHVVRETAVLGGLATAYVVFREGVYWLADKQSGNTSTAVPRPRSVVLPANTVAGGVVATAVVLAYRSQDGPDREAAVLGLVSCALFATVVVGLAWPRRYSVLRACAVLVLLGAGVAFGSYQNAAGRAGFTFLHEGRVPNNFRLVLSIYAGYVQPVVLDGHDPMGLCDTPAYYQFLGSAGGVSYLLVRPQPPDHLHERAQPPYVARLQDTDYRFRMALLHVPRGALTGAWPGPPVPCTWSPGEVAGVASG